MSKTILIVEDEPFIVDALTFLLEREGHAVLNYRDGAGCFEHIKQSSPDLVILDMMLPNVSGMEILENIRADAQISGLPVLVLTAKGQTKDRLAAEGAGASLFMSKPFANADITSSVRSLLDG
jgi:DNA-binding response OmpR family regulator